jgi:EmrB/QacA subfamily drug resistance transporter
MPRTESSSPARGSALALLVIATAQLMLVLDDTIANIALPSIQREFAVSASTLPWVINAYLLAFGGLLLFGGRVGDLYGRRRVFRIGLMLFTLASLLGGLALNVEMVIGFRALQGVGAALAAPNALALITSTFPVGKPRNSAMAAYGAMSALGITLGVLLGGVLTGLLSWRWVFFINIPIAVAVLAGSGTLVEGTRGAGRLDTPAAAAGTGAMVALTYGVTRAGEHGWGDAATWVMFAIAVGLAALFVAIQRRREDPMLPLWLVAERNRAGSYAAMLFIGAGLMGTFYLLTLFLQQVQQFSPMKTGLASLPFSVGIILGAGISSKLVERKAPRFVAGPGLVIGSAGMFWLSTLAVDSAYFTHIMPGVFIASFGLGMAAVAITLTAVYGVAEESASIASAVVNTSQQLGAALGLAVFTSIATSVAGVSGTAAVSAEALTAGYRASFLAAAVMLMVAAALVLTAVNTKHTQRAAALAA